MPPGLKRGPRKPQAAEAPLTEYDTLRAQNIMRNNQVLQRLGVSALASIVNSTSAKKKGGGPQLSGSLYDGQDSEGSGEEEVSKVAKDVHNKSGGALSANIARASKRVMAPEQREQPTRVTRQKTAATQQVPTLSLTAIRQHELASTTSPSQNEEQVHITEEDVVTRSIQEVQRKRSMGKGLDKTSRGLGTFLQNVGLQLASKKSFGGTVSLQVQDLQAQLEAKKQGSAVLRDKIDSQQDDLENLKKLEESEAAREKQSEEIENLKKQAEENKKHSEETNALLRRVLSLNRVGVDAKNER